MNQYNIGLCRSGEFYHQKSSRNFSKFQGFFLYEELTFLTKWIIRSMSQFGIDRRFAYPARFGALSKIYSPCLSCSSLRSVCMSAPIYLLCSFNVKKKILCTDCSELFVDNNIIEGLIQRIFDMTWLQ